MDNEDRKGESVNALVQRLNDTFAAIGTVQGSLNDEKVGRIAADAMAAFTQIHDLMEEALGEVRQYVTDDELATMQAVYFFGWTDLLEQCITAYNIMRISLELRERDNG